MIKLLDNSLKMASLPKIPDIKNQSFNKQSVPGRVETLKMCMLEAKIYLAHMIIWRLSEVHQDMNRSSVLPSGSLPFLLITATNCYSHPLHFYHLEQLTTHLEWLPSRRVRFFWQTSYLNKKPKIRLIIYCHVKKIVCISCSSKDACEKYLIGLPRGFHHVSFVFSLSVHYLRRRYLCTHRVTDHQPSCFLTHLCLRVE